MTRVLLSIVRDEVDDAALAMRICQACVEGLDIDGAAISLLTDSPSRETLWATDPTATRLEELQFTLGEGACIEAAMTGRVVLVPDVGAEAAGGSNWPMFAAAVAEDSRVGALFALPLQLGTINLGVLDLYRTRPGPMSGAQLREAACVADTAAIMLLGLRTDPGNGRWLDSSWTGYAEVHQATGMILAQLGVSAQEAFARLRAYAFAEDRLLRDVACDVVARRLRFTEDMT